MDVIKGKIDSECTSTKKPSNSGYVAHVECCFVLKLKESIEK